MSIFKRNKNKFSRGKTDKPLVKAGPLVDIFDLKDLKDEQDGKQSPLVSDKTTLADVPDDAKYTLKKIQSQKKESRNLFALNKADASETNVSDESIKSPIDEARELAAIQVLKKRLLNPQDTNDTPIGDMTAKDTSVKTETALDTALDDEIAQELDAEHHFIEAFEQDMSHIKVIEADPFDRESLDFEPLSENVAEVLVEPMAETVPEPVAEDVLADITVSDPKTEEAADPALTSPALSESLLIDSDEMDPFTENFESSSLLGEIETALEGSPRADMPYNAADLDIQPLAVTDLPRDETFIAATTASIDETASPSIEASPSIDVSADIAERVTMPLAATTAYATSLADTTPIVEGTADVKHTSAADLGDIENFDIGSIGDQNLSELRHDISKISIDVENGDALYRRAQARIKNLNSFAEKAEISFSLVARLEPENRRLKARNLSLSREMEKNTHTISCLENDLASHKERLSDVLNDLEVSSNQLAQTTVLLGSAEKDLASVRQDRDVQTLRGDREKNAFDIETQENENLRAQVSKLKSELDATGTEKTTLLNQAETLKIELEDQRDARGSSEKNALDLAIELETTRKQNNEMTIQIASINEDIKNFKTQYEYNLMTRDDRIFALEAEIDGLTKQLSLKDEILSNTSQNAESLRKSRSDNELERERLERFICNQSEQLKLAEAQLLKSRANIHELDKRYKDAAIALSHVHKRRNEQKPSITPDIRPAMPSTEVEGLEGRLSDQA